MTDKPLFIHVRPAGRVAISTPDGVLTTTEAELKAALTAAKILPPNPPVYDTCDVCGKVSRFSVTDGDLFSNCCGARRDE